MRVAYFAIASVLMALAVEVSAADDGSTAPAESSIRPNIYSGNWSLGGNLYFAKNSGSVDSTECSTFVAARYFLIDRFALGMVAGFEDTTDTTAIASLGPSAAYYFLTQGRLAMSALLGFRLGLTDDTYDKIVNSGIGAEYFLTPSVAVGPTAFFTYYSSGGSNEKKRFGISFDLLVYL
jgi:hypothetical protein